MLPQGLLDDEVAAEGGVEDALDDLYYDSSVGEDSGTGEDSTAGEDGAVGKNDASAEDGASADGAFR